MIILAIDPGPVKSAWVRLDSGKVRESAHEDNAEVLKLLRGATPALGQILAVEMIACYGMPVGAEVFETCVWTGRFMEAWIQQTALPVTRVPRIKIKTHLCNSARAKDGNVRQALIDRLGAPGTKKDPGPTYGVSGDVWAALAVGVYVADHQILRAA